VGRWTAHRAVQHAPVPADVSTVTGLDGALTTIGSAGAGPWLPTGVAAGFATLGVHAPDRARYPSS
jgi:hypothetical protein